MSRLLNSADYDPREFEIGDIIEFDAPFDGGRRTGEVVRVYNSRTVYHAVGRDGYRYEVTYADNLTLIRRAST